MGQKEKFSIAGNQFQKYLSQKVPENSPEKLRG
jgi:hypothetical protein